MEKIETLLYKVLIATEALGNRTDGTCLPAEYFEKTKECINLGDIMCTSIDLLANETVCYECVSCSENTIVPCKHYGKLTKPLSVPDIQVTISNTYTKSNVLDFKMDNMKNFVVEVSGCEKCVQSQYNYTLIFDQSHVQAYPERPLRCHCDDVEYKKLYCRAWDPPTCYKKEAECSWDETTLNCMVSKYGDNETHVIIKGFKKDKCQRWNEVKDCNISVTFDDNSLDIIHNKKQLEWTENLLINVSCNDPCSALLHDICNQSFSDMECKIIPPDSTLESSQVPKLTSEPKDDKKSDRIDEDNEKGTSTTLLIVIIIVLLLLLLLYVGYQNHQKVSCYMAIYI